MARVRGILYDNTTNKIYTNAISTSSGASVYPGSFQQAFSLVGSSATVNNSPIGSWTLQRNVTTSSFQSRINFKTSTVSGTAAGFNMVLTVSNTLVTNLAVTSSNLCINNSTSSTVIGNSPWWITSNTTPYNFYAGDLVTCYTVQGGQSTPILYYVTYS